MADAKGVKWHGKEFMSKFDRAQAKQMNKAVTLLFNEVRQSISTPGRTVETVVTKTGKTRKKYGKKGEFVSAPGQPPYKQSGRLYRSLKKRVFPRGVRGRVTDRGRLTEFGTKHMEARPHLRPALDKLKSAIAGILTADISAQIQGGY
jgi:HK97 gp10 family phage protein